MASAQVDGAHLEEITKSSTEESTVESPTANEKSKAGAPQNIQSPYEDDDEEPEDVISPEELGKHETRSEDDDDGDDDDDDEDQKGTEPHTIDDDDDEESGMIAAGKGHEFSDEDGDVDASD